MKLFENPKVKGAVSIFLILILIPTMLFSVVLIDGSRLASAKAIAQEATDLAAASAMAAYNQELKDEFGLFAINDNENLEAIYKESLENTLMACGLSGDSQYSARLWEIFKTTVTGNKSYAGEDFLNLYDFAVEGGTMAEPKFCLAEKDVLESQMIEYSKFRGLYVMADRMDLLKNLDLIQSNAGKNKEASEVMEDKMDVDEKNADADKQLSVLRDRIGELNASIGAIKQQENRYLEAMIPRMKQVRIENTDVEEELNSSEKRLVREYSRRKGDLKNTVKDAQKQAKAVLKQAETAKKKVEKGIENLEKFKAQHGGKAQNNETVKELIADADANITNYKDKYLVEIQKILDDPILNRLAEDTQIGSRMSGVQEDIDDAIEKYIDELKEMKQASGEEEAGEEAEEEEITEYFFYFLNGSGRTEDEREAASGGQSKTRYYEAAVKDVTSYFRNHYIEAINPTKDIQETGASPIDDDFASNQSEKMNGSGQVPVQEAGRREISQEIYNTRPSKTYVSEEASQKNSGFYNKDGDLSASKNILNQSQNSILLQLGEATRDDVLCFTYMFGTFKTRLTGNSRFTSGGMPQTDKQSFYMPGWRHSYEGGELDMRFEPKKDRNTVLRSEIEYLVYGNRTDAANEAAVYATIMAERLANNVAAMYMEKEVINPACHLAAAAASAATAFAVPETVFFWIFLTAWATAETLIEMDYLISYGYKVPLFKTNKNILLKEVPTGEGKGLIGNYGEKGLFVTYEDYLLILLLIKGSDKRIMRTADLIEMNMKKNGQSDFTMAKAYTTLHAETRMSIRYLFGSVMPFKESYEEQGYTGRIHFTNTIYQSY